MRNAHRNRTQLAFDMAAGRTRSRGRRLPEGADGADTGRIAVGQRGIDGYPGVPAPVPRYAAPSADYSWLGRCTIRSREKSEHNSNLLSWDAYGDAPDKDRTLDWIERICARGRATASRKAELQPYGRGNRSGLYSSARYAESAPCRPPARNGGIRPSASLRHRKTVI